VVGGYPIIQYIGFPRGINIVNKKKKNKIDPIGNISGLFILPSNMVYTQPYDGC
jgi:hypothetical protein